MEKVADPFSNNAVAPRGTRKYSEEESAGQDQGKGKREREEELWERRENCKTTYRATAHAERITPRCGLKPPAQFSLAPAFKARYDEQISLRIYREGKKWGKVVYVINTK